jgi:hypothetical protein
MHKNCERTLRSRERLEVVVDHLKRLSFYPLHLGGDKGEGFSNGQALSPSPSPKGRGGNRSQHPRLSPPLGLVMFRQRFNQVIKRQPQTPTVMEEEERKC